MKEITATQLESASQNLFAAFDHTLAGLSEAEIKTKKKHLEGAVYMIYEALRSELSKR